MNCTRCGSRIPTGSYYCDCCGKQIELEARYSGILKLKVAPGGQKPGAGYLYAGAGPLGGIARPKEAEPGPVGKLLRRIGAVLMKLTLPQALVIFLVSAVIEYAITWNILRQVWVYQDFSLPGLINMFICRFLPFERQVPFYLVGRQYLNATGIDLFLWIVLDIVKFIPVVLALTGGWRMFEKAGVPGKKYLIPLYNVYYITKIATGSGRFFWTILGLSVLACIGASSGAESSIYGLIFMLGFCYIYIMGKLGQSFGKKMGLGIWLTLLPFFVAAYLDDYTRGGTVYGFWFLPEILICLIGFGASKYVGPPAKKSKKAAVAAAFTPMNTGRRDAGTYNVPPRPEATVSEDLGSMPEDLPAGGTAGGSPVTGGTAAGTSAASGDVEEKTRDE